MSLWPSTEVHPALGASATDRALRIPNQAIRERPVVENEIYREFFDGVLQQAVFEHWQDPRGRFHLRCFGGPGSGKTTFTAVASEKLRSAVGTSATDAIAVIFVAEKIEWDSEGLEYVLESILHQLCPVYAIPPSIRCQAAYASFITARRRNDPASIRRLDLHEALRNRLADLDRAFVLIDGLDRGQGSAPSLESQLADFGSAVKMLSTARAFTLELDEFLQRAWPGKRFVCDGNDCPNRTPPEASVCWACDHGHETTLCWICHARGDGCPECCGPSRFKQSPQVCVDMRHAFGSKIHDYIRWDMEREYGNLGLGSGHCDPELSPARPDVVLTPVELDALQVKLNAVERKADNNIALARLRMELIHASAAVGEVDDGLPRELVVLFNAVVDGCTDLGIRAIAATVYHIETEPGHPLPLDKLEVMLGFQPDPKSAPVELLRAAAGLLVVSLRERSNQRIVVFYAESFEKYACQQYNERLELALAGFRSTPIMKGSRFG